MSSPRERTGEVLQEGVGFNATNDFSGDALHKHSIYTCHHHSRRRINNSMSIIDIHTARQATDCSKS